MTTNNPLSVRQVARLLKKFKIENGNVLAVKHQSENANKEAIETIGKAISQMGINVLIVVVNDFDDLTVLNETEMNKRGWYRLKSLQRVMSHSRTDAEKIEKPETEKHVRPERKAEDD